MCNAEVVDRWVQGCEGFTRSLKTDGRDLWSYDLKIGTTCDTTGKILIDYTADGGWFISQTTSSHVGLARVLADLIVDGNSPIIEALKR